MSDPPTYTAGMTIETNYNAGPGSLGCFARDAGGKPVLLSCSHVIFAEFLVVGDMRVFAPDYSSCCSGGDPIARPIFDPNLKARSDTEGGVVGGYLNGTWTGGFNWIPTRVRGPGGTNIPGNASEVDCAIARLNPGVRFHNVWRVRQGSAVTEIPLKGAVTDGLGIGKGPALGTAPTEQQYARAYGGMSERLVYGTMVSTPPDIPHADDPDRLLFRWGISDSSDQAQGIKTSVNQFLMLPRPTPKPGQSLAESYRQGERLGFLPGDSGSLVINHQNQVIGMIIRITPIETLTPVDRSLMEFADVKNFAVVTPIQRILEHLQIEIPAVDAGWSGTAPSAGPVALSHPAADGSRRAERHGLERLREGLRASVRGRLLLGKIGQHRREVRRLLTSVRPIAAAWRHFNGPAFYHHCVLSVREPGHLVPDQVNGVHRQDLLDALLPLLDRHAGPALRRDLRRYGPAITSALLPVGTVHDVPAALARIGVRS